MLSIIAAMSENRVIGRGGELPWRQRDDMRRFKELTTGHAVIMGRKTWESIDGQPLPNRLNIVVTRNPEFEADAVVAHDLVEAIAVAASHEMTSEWSVDGAEPELFVVGGAPLYRESLGQASRLYLTIVHTTIADGDAFFPEFDEGAWVVVEEEHHSADECNEHAFTFRTLERVGTSKA